MLCSKSTSARRIGYSRMFVRLGPVFGYIDWGVLPEDHRNPERGKKHGSKGAGIEDFPEKERGKYVNQEELPRLIAALDEEDIFTRSAIIRI